MMSLVERDMLAAEPDFWSLGDRNGTILHRRTE